MLRWKLLEKLQEKAGGGESTRQNIKAKREAGHTKPFKVPGLLSLIPKHEPRQKGHVLYCWLPGRFDGKWSA